MSVLVVKLGGSLANSEELPQWLHVIASAGAGKTVLVPGGGHWADAVRAAQEREGFDDRVAHHKALGAMERYGELLAGMQADLVPAKDLAAIGAILHGGQVAVWMPYDMVVADASIPQTWNVTSDSLAAWLARQLDAALLVLVKSVSVADPGMPAVDMVKSGWVDACFEEYCAGGNFRYRVLGKGDHPRLGRLLAEDKTDAAPGEAAASGR